VLRVLWLSLDWVLRFGGLKKGAKKARKARREMSRWMGLRDDDLLDKWLSSPVVSKVHARHPDD
jgi:hypothetical protein